MAFPQGFPFNGEACFVQQSCTGGGQGSCRATARAFAGGHCGPRSGFRSSVQFGDGPAREFQVVDTPEAFLIYFDASGFAREDIKVRVSEDGKLHLTVKKGEETAVEKSWTFSGENVLRDGISARFGENNELVITVPKVPDNPKASFDVPIETESQGPQAPAAHVPNDAPKSSGAQQQAEQDVDGSWVEVADEDVARAKAKDKAPDDKSVLEAADQEPRTSNRE